MNRIEIKDFSIKIDKDKVLKTLGCFEGSSVYETVSSYFDELEETVMDLLSPRAVAVTEVQKSLGVLKNVLMHRKIFHFLNNLLLSQKQALTE